MAYSQAGTRDIGRRPTRRLVLAGLVPTVAAIAAGAVFVAADGSGTAPGPRETQADGAAASGATNPPPTSARELFLVAAERNMSRTASSGRYWVTSSEHGDVRSKGPANRPYNILLRLQVEMWQAIRAGEATFVAGQYLGAAPVTAADRAAWEADGSPTQWTESPPPGGPDAEPIVVKAAAEPRYARPIDDPTRERTYPLAGGLMTVAQLAALPTDPAALKAWLLNRFKDQGNLEPTDYSLFWSGANLVSDLPVPPQVRVAAYRMLADVTGVAFLGPATDQRGRDGVAVAFTRRGDGGGWGQTRLIVDPRTGQALAEESWSLGKDRSAASTGQLIRYTMVLSAGFSDDTPPTGLPTHPAGK